MANALFQRGRESFLLGQIAWTTDNIKAALINPNYVPDLTAHRYYSSISSYLLTGTTTAVTLTNKDSSNVLGASVQKLGQISTRINFIDKIEDF